MSREWHLKRDRKFRKALALTVAAKRQGSGRKSQERRISGSRTRLKGTP